MDGKNIKNRRKERNLIKRRKIREDERQHKLVVWGLSTDEFAN
jgi:hypothetical protein